MVEDRATDLTDISPGELPRFSLAGLSFLVQAIRTGSVEPSRLAIGISVMIWQVRDIIVISTEPRALSQFEI